MPWHSNAKLKKLVRKKAAFASKAAFSISSQLTLNSLSITFFVYSFSGKGLDNIPQVVYKHVIPLVE
jgi:hypothetical protein